jgi:hypothetical protein
MIDLDHLDLNHLHHLLDHLALDHSDHLALDHPITSPDHFDHPIISSAII